MHKHWIDILLHYCRGMHRWQCQKPHELYYTFMAVSHRPLPQQLRTHYPRQLDVSNHHGLQNHISSSPLPKPQTSSNFLHAKRGEVLVDPKHAKQICYLRNREHPGKVLLLVPKKDGRQRPVINLKQLNQSLNTKHFKMECILIFKALLNAGDWTAKTDLKPWPRRTESTSTSSARERYISSTVCPSVCHQPLESLPRPHSQ